MKKRQRILILERKISVLRLDAAHFIQALSCPRKSDFPKKKNGQRVLNTLTQH
jgi:hypothetical protein